MGQGGADEIDLTHPLCLDRCRPLLVGALSQRCREDVARRVCNGIERRQDGEERSKLIDVGGFGPVGASSPADVDDLVAVVSQGLLRGGTEGSIPNDNDFQGSLPEGPRAARQTGPDASGRMIGNSRSNCESVRRDRDMAVLCGSHRRWWPIRSSPLKTPTSAGTLHTRPSPEG